MVDIVDSCEACGPNGGKVRTEKNGKVTYECALGDNDCQALRLYKNGHKGEDMPVKEKRSYLMHIDQNRTVTT